MTIIVPNLICIKKPENRQRKNQIRNAPKMHGTWPVNFDTPMTEQH